MKNVLASLVLCIVVTYHALGQDYKTHKIKSGETIESIARQYQVTPFDIYVLNPDAKTGFAPNLTLIIPKSKLLDTPIEVEERQLLNYATHKVKRKETLFSIAQQYNVEVEDIKKYNERLYSEVLKKGDRIQIPKYSIVKTTTNIGNTLKTYKVQQSEGKWRVAYKFGISVAELEQLNPKLGDSLQLGQEIVVPNIADNEEKVVDETFGYYTVLPKEGFLAIYRKTGLTQVEIETLNPEIKDVGLKVGMILKVPKSVEERLINENYETLSLANSIVNYDTKEIAVMLPFRLHQVDLDSTHLVKDMIRRENSTLNIALDFHTGVLMAIDSAKQLGISTKLDVYDTKARVGDVTRIINSNNFSDYDAVIGPFLSNNFERASSMLKSQNIPTISPVTKPDNLYRNVFQTIPNRELLLNKIATIVEQDTAVVNIIIVADSENRQISNALKQRFPRAKQIFSKTDKEEGKDLYYNIREDFEEEFLPGLNVVFLETSNNGYVSNISSMMTSFIDEELEIDVMLMTTDKNRAFEASNISNNDLSKLRFHYPTTNKPYYPEDEKIFVTNYKSKFGTEPNRYAIRGFDVTMDVLLRLASNEEGLLDSTDDALETEYVENKFRYSKKLFGGYYNEAVYVVKYEDLNVVEVKQ